MTTFLPAPPDYVVDLDHPKQQYATVSYWCFGIGVLFSLLFTAQRVYVKVALKLSWQLDDSLLAVSWVTSMAVQASMIRNFAHGVLGVHVWEMSVEHFAEIWETAWVSGPLYALAGSSTKVALLIFYLRVSPDQWLRYTVLITIFAIVGYTIGIFFSLIFACTPIRKAFDVTIPPNEGHCISRTGLYIATAVCNIVSDVILFVLPMPLLFPLQMPLKQKLGLYFIFGIGSITLVTSVLRATQLPILLTTDDVTWDVAPPSLLVIIESNLIIICGMFPTLQKFFRLVAPRLIGEVGDGQHGGDNVQAGSGFSGFSGFKTPSWLATPKPPHFLASGSQAIVARCWARFSRRRSDYAYHLATIEIADDDVEGQASSSRTIDISTTAREH